MGWPEWTLNALLAASIILPAAARQWREVAANAVSAVILTALLYAGGFYA